MPRERTREIYCQTCKQRRSVPTNYDFKFWGECYTCHFDLPVEKKRRNDIKDLSPDHEKTYHGDDDEDS